MAAVVSGPQHHVASEAEAAHRAIELDKLTEKVRVLLRGARGRRLAATNQTLNPVLRGWAAYFKLFGSKRALEERDGWTEVTDSALSACPHTFVCPISRNN